MTIIFINIVTELKVDVRPYAQRPILKSELYPFGFPYLQVIGETANTLVFNKTPNVQFVRERISNIFL